MFIHVRYLKITGGQQRNYGNYGNTMEHRGTFGGKSAPWMGNIGKSRLAMEVYNWENHRTSHGALVWEIIELTEVFFSASHVGLPQGMPNKTLPL